MDNLEGRMVRPFNTYNAREIRNYMKFTLITKRGAMQRKRKKTREKKRKQNHKTLNRRL